MNLGGINYNGGAVLSLQSSKITLATASRSIIDEMFPVNAFCPFFYIYGVGGPGGSSGDAYSATFDFTNGGTILTSQTVVWGDPAVLETVNTESRVMVQTCVNDGFVYFNDTVGGICVTVLPGANDVGFVMRWSALADSVRVRVASLNLGTLSGTYQICAGIIQQPW